MTTINPDKLLKFEQGVIARSSHPSFEAGACSMEWVAWLANEGHTDAPQCASPVLARYVIRLNDRWGHEQRQTLKPYLLRMIGTGDDGKDGIRERIAARWVATRLLPDWLRLAGMDDQIAALEEVTPGDTAGLRSTLYAVRKAAWAKRDERRAAIKAAVKAELAKREKPVAAADADAAADAVAAVVAAAAADAAADAVAAAAAAVVAAAAAAVVADADADAVAATDADAVAAAAAAVVADAAAAADAGDSYWGRYDAAYSAARKVFDAKYADGTWAAPIKALVEQQAPAALELLDLLIDAKEA